jgi:hypothetical protein
LTSGQSLRWCVDFFEEVAFHKDIVITNCQFLSGGSLELTPDFNMLLDGEIAPEYLFID